MKIRVNPDWLKACGRNQDQNIFDVVHVADYGSRGKMYTVKDPAHHLPNREWVVWSIRGVEEINDQ